MKFELRDTQITHGGVQAATAGLGVAGPPALCALLVGSPAHRPLAWALVTGLVALTALVGWWGRVAHTREAGERLRDERRRIAQDLHDGLAQDLALIALHGDRLSRDLGAEHPVALAARRALAVTRGTMIDLAASGEPTTLDALHAVADELESRYPVDITVSRLEAGIESGAEFSPAQRHQVVRIAREALLNAVRHGAAGRVSVGLGSPGGDDAILRVIDDGVGIGSARAEPGGTGMGLPGMRRRAGILDARLHTRRRVAGGTEVSVRRAPDRRIARVPGTS